MKLNSLVLSPCSTSFGGVKKHSSSSEPWENWARKESTSLVTSTTNMTSKKSNLVVHQPRSLLSVLEKDLCGCIMKQKLLLHWQRVKKNKKLTSIRKRNENPIVLNRFYSWSLLVKLKGSSAKTFIILWTLLYKFKDLNQLYLICNLNHSPSIPFSFHFQTTEHLRNNRDKLFLKKISSFQQEKCLLFVSSKPTPSQTCAIIEIINLTVFRS